MAVSFAASTQTWLTQHGWPDAAARAAGGAIEVLVFSVWVFPIVKHIHANMPHREITRRIAFVAIVMAGIFAAKSLLGSLFGSFGWPREIQYYGGWFGAFIVLAYPISALSRRLGIELSDKRLP